MTTIANEWYFDTEEPPNWGHCRCHYHPARGRCSLYFNGRYVWGGDSEWFEPGNELNHSRNYANYAPPYVGQIAWIFDVSNTVRGLNATKIDYYMLYIYIFSTVSCFANMDQKYPVVSKNGKTMGFATFHQNPSDTNCFFTIDFQRPWHK